MSSPKTTPQLCFQTLDGTNAEALRRAAKGERGPIWIVASEQRTGRGRGGRLWVSPPGNLYASYLFDPQSCPADGALYSFVAAVAVAETLATYIEHAVELKWPNDLLVNDSKIAGILLESSGGHEHLSWLVIGIGVNLIPVAEHTGRAVISLAELCQELPTPDEFLSRLDQHLQYWQHVFVTKGFAPIRLAWLERAAYLNQPIKARTAMATYDGVFRGVNNQGALLLDISGEIREINAADVYFAANRGDGYAVGD